MWILFYGTFDYRTKRQRKTPLFMVARTIPKWSQKLMKTKRKILKRYAKSTVLLKLHILLNWEMTYLQFTQPKPKEKTPKAAEKEDLADGGSDDDENGMGENPNDGVVCSYSVIVFYVVLENLLI